MPGNYDVAPLLEPDRFPAGAPLLRPVDDRNCTKVWAARAHRLRWASERARKKQKEEKEERRASTGDDLLRSA